MIKKLGSLKNSTTSRYLVKINVRYEGRILSSKRVVHGPRWQAEELEVKLRKELRASVQLHGDFDTLDDVLDYYLTQHLVFQKSYKKCVSYIHRLKKDLGHVKLRKFNLELFRKYLRQDVKARHKEHLKNATLNRIHAFAKAALQFAAENGKIPENPLRYTRTLRLKEYSRDRILTDQEWGDLKANLPVWLLPVITFAYLVPTRAQELKSLKRKWIKGSKIWIPGHVTKTGDPRYLPIPAMMENYFGKIPDESEYVFYRRDSNGYHPILNLRTDEGSLGNAVQAAQINDFRFHDFRHTAATNLRRRGVRIELIMAIGGWKTIPTFLRYSNYTDDELTAIYRD